MCVIPINFSHRQNGQNQQVVGKPINFRDFEVENTPHNMINTKAEGLAEDSAYPEVIKTQVDKHFN